MYFPLVWARNRKDVLAENVTERYAPKANMKTAAVPDTGKSAAATRGSSSNAWGQDGFDPRHRRQGLRQGSSDESRRDSGARAALEAHVALIQRERADEIKNRVLKDGELEMPFFYKTFGEKPANGRSLWISLHGGGGVPKQVNDSQWERHKKLYTVEEGIYLAPRAPTNTWNLWHQAHIDRLFGRLIEDLIVLEEVNPDRVYLLGYSAGGDGVYQLGTAHGRLLGRRRDDGRSSERRFDAFLAKRAVRPSSWRQ